MLLNRKIYFAESEEEKQNASTEIPEDDGHQMSQSEIDDLIAKLLNQ